MLYFIIALFCMIAACSIGIVANSKEPNTRLLASVAIVANAVVSGVCIGLLSKFM